MSGRVAPARPTGSPRLRRLVLGDWSWVVRDPLDVLRLCFLGGTIAFALMGRSTAVGLTAASALLLVVRIVDLPRRFDLAIIVAMTLIAWGTAFGLYGDYYVYDNVVHTVSPFFYAPVLYVVLVRLDVLAGPERTSATHHHVGVFISTLALGMAVGAGYEVIEWLSDSLLGTHLVHSVDDTGSDLLEDTVGSLAGAAFATAWSVRGWTSRRVPGAAAARPAPRLAGPLAGGLRRRLATRSRQGVLGWTTRLAGLPLALSGLVALAAGAATLAWPSPALRTVELVFATAILAEAVLDLPAALSRRRPGRRWARLATVAAEAAVGGIVIAWPGVSRLALVYVVGASAVVLALLEAASLSSRVGSDRERWLAGTASVSAFVFGVVLLALPHRSFDATVVVFALYLLSVGALRLVRSLAARVGRRRSAGERRDREVDDQREVVGAAAGAEPPADDG